MTQEILVPVPPSSPPAPGTVAPARRDNSARVALLLDNSKTHGSTILDSVAALLAARDWSVERLRKRTASSPAPQPALEELAPRVSLCVTALSD